MILKFLRKLFWISCVFNVLILIPIIVIYFQNKPFLSFCDSIKTTDKISEVFKLAKNQDFFFFDDDKTIEKGNVSISNHKSPLGRLTCVVTLENSKIIKVEQIATD